MTLGLIVCGVGGRMGGAVVRAIQQSRDTQLLAAIDRPGSARLGKDAGEVAAAGHLGIKIGDAIEGHLTANSVIIDFTTPAASVAFLRATAKKRAPVVIATTGMLSGIFVLGLNAWMQQPVGF